MSSSQSSSDGNLPMSTILHMITKLNSSSYLLWINQMILLLSYQKVMNHVDGSVLPPAKIIIAEDKPIANPTYISWYEVDQQAVILLLSSPSEEFISEVLGLSIAAQIWYALQSAYSGFSVD